MEWPMGVHEMHKMGENEKNWENGQKLVKKMRKFSLSQLKSMQLYITHQLVPKNDEQRPWGGPWGCAKCSKCAKMKKNWENGQKSVKKMRKFSISRLKSMHLYFTHQLVPKMMN